MMRLLTSASCGPDLVVVIRRVIPTNDRAHMPEPISRHCSSSCGIKLPKILWAGPCRCGLTLLVVPPATMVSPEAGSPSPMEAIVRFASWLPSTPPGVEPRCGEASTMETSVPAPALGSMSATVESACRFLFAPPTVIGSSEASPAAGSMSRMSTSGLRFRDTAGGSGAVVGPADPDDPPVSVASSATGGSLSTLRFFSSASANIASDLR